MRCAREEAGHGHRPSLRRPQARGMTATGPAIMEVDSAVARAAIERDLSCYADQWKHLQGVEVEAAYGPIDPELADIQELR